MNILQNISVCVPQKKNVIQSMVALGLVLSDDFFKVDWTHLNLNQLLIGRNSS